MVTFRCVARIVVDVTVRTRTEEGELRFEGGETGEGGRRGGGEGAVGGQEEGGDGRGRHGSAGGRGGEGIRG